MAEKEFQRVRVIDSHTGGEPTRLVISGGPDLGRGPLPERLKCFRSLHDFFRSAVVNEPRGSDVMVGALLCDPVDPAGGAGGVYRVAQQRSHHYVGAAGFVYDGGSKVVVFGAEACEARRQRAVAEIWPAVDHHAGGLAAGVGINDSNSAR